MRVSNRRWRNVGAMMCAVASTAVIAGWPAAWAQSKRSETTTIKGTVQSVERKGRAVALTVKPEEGEPLEFLLTPRIEFVVTGEADEGFLAPNQFVSTTAVLTNDRLFAKEFTVLLVEGKSPRPVLAKAPPQAGQSKNSVIVSGPIVSRQPDEQYKEYETILVKVGGPRGTPVFLDKGFVVKVASTDPTLAKPDSPVELEVRPLTGGRVNVLKATVTLKEPLNSKDYLAEQDKAK